MILLEWNAEKVFVLAEDPAVAKEAKKLAIPSKWVSLGRDDYSVWGEYKGSGKDPYKVKIDLLRLQANEAGYHCTCPSRKQPCKHILSLLFIITEQSDTIAVSTPPQYVQDWLDKQAQRTRKDLEKKKNAEPKTVNIEQQTKTLNERQRKITEGFQELELWLVNLIRHGFADPQIKQYSFWDAKAARMVDAQAPGIAAWLRTMAGIPLQGTEWIEPLLVQLGRLYLTIQSFKQFDQLPEAMQADLRAVLGWPYKREEVTADTGIADTWIVLGRHEEQLENKLRAQRLWLRGTSTHRDALILEFAFGHAPFDTHLLPGWAINAEMVYFPSAYPLRAFVKTQRAEFQGGFTTTGITISSGIEQYSKALSCNPWLLYFPLLLDDVIPTRLSSKWIIRDTGGAYLLLAGTFPHKLSLLALSGGNPIQLAGEWNGQEFLPTGAVVNARFVDFTAIGKLS